MPMKPPGAAKAFSDPSLDHEEREPEVLAIGRCDEPVPERLDVLLDLGIADQGEPRSDFAHERLPERALLGG